MIQETRNTDLKKNNKNLNVIHSVHKAFYGSEDRSAPCLKSHKRDSSLVFQLHLNTCSASVILTLYKDFSDSGLDAWYKNY